MTQATITSYTLLDFIPEGDMNLFFSFIEEHMDEHAARLRENGMTKFYVTGFSTRATSSPSPTG